MLFERNEESPETDPTGIETDPTHVYVANRNSPSGVLRWSKAGGATEHVQGTGRADALALDDLYVYTLGTSGLRRGPKEGGASELLASFGGISHELVLDGDDIFGLAGGALPDGEDGVVFRIPKAGGAATHLAGGIGVGGGQLALSASDVYWTQQGMTEPSGTLRHVPRTGGAATEIVSGTNVVAVAVAGDALYWSAPPTASEPLPTAIWRSALDGSGARILATSQDFVVQIVEHAGCLYVLDIRRIGRISLGGGEIAPITATTSPPYAMAVDDSGIYWTDHALGRVLMVAW